VPFQCEATPDTSADQVHADGTVCQGRKAVPEASICANKACTVLSGSLSSQEMEQRHCACNTVTLPDIVLEQGHDQLHNMHSQLMLLIV